MIRDITIGQYYPAQSQVHRLDPRVKIVCTLAFLIFAEQYFRICSCICISCNGDPAFKSAGKIYCQRTEPQCDPAAFYSADEPVPYEEWKYPLSLWNPYNHGGRSADMRFYDGEIDLSGDGIFHHDIYDHPEQPDRRNRKAASSAEPDPCSGA